MEVSGYEVFLWGVAGPVLMELVKIAGWRDLRKVTIGYTNPIYIVSTVALLILGGVVAWLNGTDHVPVMRAVQLGIGAPAILAGYATASRKPGSNMWGDDQQGKSFPRKVKEALA